MRSTSAVEVELVQMQFGNQFNIHCATCLEKVKHVHMMGGKQHTDEANGHEFSEKGCTAKTKYHNYNSNNPYKIK